MDASSTTVTEFIQQAKAYCLAKDKKAITGWENYLGSVQKADVKFQFQLFLEVISCSFSSHNEVGLLAAQSLRGLCRRGQVGDDHLQAMVHLLRKMSIANKSHSCQLIVTQIVLAVGACFVMRTATELCNIPPSNHIDSAVHMMKQWLEYMQHQQIDTKLQVQVLSAIPEHCEYKDLKSALPVKGPQQVIYIKSVQSALVFCASNVIELLKPVMSQYGEMNGDTAGLANYQQCIKCCSAWVKLHQTVVEAADRSQNSLVALTSLYLRWVDQDAALVRVVRSIEQLANLDLIEAIEDDYNSLLESHVEFMHNLTELLEILCKGQCVEAREMLLQSSFQLLRHLQSILAGTEAFLGKQLNIHSSHYDADLSLCLDYCKSIVLLVAECTGHIHGGLLGLHSVQDDSIGADGTHLLENGREVVLVLSRTMFSLCDKLVAYTDHTMKTLHRNHIHRDCMIKFTREILASSMSFWTTIVVEKLTQDPSVEANFEQLLRSTLEQSILMSRFENFSGGHRDEVLAEIEAINDYRAILRDFVRDMTLARPNIFHFLLQSACDQLLEYHSNGSKLLVAKLSAPTTVKGRQSLDIAEWIVGESYLHAISAICKESLQKLLVIPNELRQVLHTFLGLLTNEAIIHTRILCRMSIILVQEISVFLIERGLWLSEIAAGDNNVQELRTCLLAVLFSLNHIEEGHFRNSKEELPDNWLKLHPLFCAGQEIAFRVKQDHIGAVSLFKFVLELTRRIKDSQLLCNILKDESTFSSLVAQIALSSQLSSHQSGRTPIQPEKGMIGALANYCFSYLMNVQEDCEGPRNINHALSPKSFGMSFSVLALIFAVLFRCGAVSDPTSDSIFAYLIPVALSSLQIVQQRVHPGNNFFSQNLNLISIQYDDATLSSMKVAIESLVHRCPLTLQLSLISELLRAFPKINLKQSQLPPDYICNRLLGISKFVLDILNTFIVSTDNNLRPLFCCMSEREIQGLTDLIVSVAEFYESISSQFPQIASSNISTQLDNLLNLYSSFASTALLQEGNYLALSAAHSITRLIVAYRPIIGSPLDSCFLKFFEHISHIGVQAVRKETIVLDGETSEMVREALLQTNSIFHMERDSKKDLRRAEDFQHILSLSFLLDFWSSGLRMTDLGIMEINKLSSKSSQAAITRIPWTSVGFPLIQSLVDILCESCLSQSDRDRTFTDTTWLQILELLQLCQGPLVNRSTQNPLGAVFTELMLASTPATEECQVIPEIGMRFIESGRGQVLVQALLHILENVLPSTIRDHGIKCLQHTFFTCGASTAARYVLMVLQGGAEGGSDEEKKAITIASHLHGAALSGDWKRFKAALKVLFR